MPAIKCGQTSAVPSYRHSRGAGVFVLEALGARRTRISSNDRFRLGPTMDKRILAGADHEVRNQPGPDDGAAPKC